MTQPSSQITVKPGEILVFATDLGGCHSNPVAREALRWGALYGVASGLCGSTYAIPVADLLYKPFSDTRVIKELQRFINFASGLPTIRFLLSDISAQIPPGSTAESVRTWISSSSFPRNVVTLDPFNV